MKASYKLMFIGALTLLTGTVTAATTVPNTFTGGTAASASEVNANFTALANAIDALEARVAALENPTIDANFLNGKTFCLMSVNSEVGASNVPTDTSDPDPANHTFAWSYAANGVARGTIVFSSTTALTLQLTTDDFYNNSQHPMSTDAGGDPGVPGTYTISNGNIAMIINDPTDGDFPVTATISPDGNVLGVTTLEYGDTDDLSGKYAFAELFLGIRSSGTCQN